MAYVDTLLTSGEHILYRTKKHWIAPVLATIPGTLITLAGIALLVLATFARNVAFLDQISLWAGIVTLLVGLAILGWSFKHWFSQEYVVTNMKVIKAEGFLNKKSEGASLEKINEIEMEQSLIGRWMNFGTLRVRTASDEADIRYWMMVSPGEFRKQILEAKYELDTSDARFIADAVHTAAAATPIPPAAAVADAGGIDPGQIPAMIQQLAALRESGAITAAEFEAKKAELLRRM